MCIAVLTTSHPQYPFILISNRDEYLSRPTHAAALWPAPHDNVLGGWDLERSAHGTWLGVTKQGKICCLTNYHEADDSAAAAAAAAAAATGAKSRGIIVNSWLKSEAGAAETPEQFAARLVAADDFTGVGGFTLTYGYVQDVCRPGRHRPAAPKGLSVLSNRAKAGAALPTVAPGPGHTVAVSNAPFGDRAWGKIGDGEALLDDAVRESPAAEGSDRLIRRLLAVLSTDRMPRWDGKEPWGQHCRRMEASVFVPRLELQRPPSGAPPPPGKDSPAGKQDAGGNGEGGQEHGTYDVQSGSQLNGSAHRGYGTQKQTVILVDQHGSLTYFERTLYDEGERLLEEGKGDRQFEFQIEGW